MSSVAVAILSCALASFGVAAALVLTSSQHGRFTYDNPIGIQKVHARPTPRVGGVGIYIGLVIALFLVHDPEVRAIVGTLLIGGAPALAIGLVEDVTQRVPVSVRLALTVSSGACASLVSGIALTRLDIPVIEAALLLPGIAFMATAVTVGGLANAINVIDGLNGLASGATALALAAIAFVAHQAGDASLSLAAAIVAASVVGFWLMNFPWGKLFLGDGGAYFAGFALGWLAVLLPMRNPSVSAWASLLICAYPVTEVLYSMTRRWMGGRPMGGADRAHLHSLVAARLARTRMRSLHPSLQHAAVSALMWMCAAIPALVAVTSPGNTPVLAAGALVCLLLYHCLYSRVARP
jgi:UDP-N-acetylmuramyl pentapeptide phosphotransferase/UDP-N-acetylglucosamine-1-phosphate transferase